MNSQKIGVALLLAVACATAVNFPKTVSDKLLKYDVAEKSTVPASTTLAGPEGPEPLPNTTSTPNTTTTSPAPSPITTSTTLSPNVTTVSPTTTLAPNITTVSPTTTPSPNTTTTAPITSTHSPNVTTTVAPSPAPAPTPGRTWDGPSFFGGMVLAFGLVGIGYVGYRFFYLGRGGAYHTL